MRGCAVAEELPARLLEFAERVEALLAEFADLVGPVTNEAGEVLSAAQIAEAVPLPDCRITEWLTVMLWQDLRDGTAYITKACQPRMLPHHQIGLLRSWLATMEYGTA